MVCNFCRTVINHTEGVRLLREEPGPNVRARNPNGANVWYTYSIE